jgi:hypothetical protein
VMGRFKVTRKRVWYFVKFQLQWSYQWAITSCGKLPYDWENEGKFMVYKVAYLVKAYDIPLILIMNNDRIGMVLSKYYAFVKHEYE